MGYQVGRELYRQPSVVQAGAAEIAYHENRKITKGAQRLRFAEKALISLLYPVLSTCDVAKTSVKALGAVALAGSTLCLPDPLSRQARTWSRRYPAKLAFKVGRLVTTTVMAGPYFLGYLGGVFVPALGRATDQLRHIHLVAGYRIQGRIEEWASCRNDRWRQFADVTPEWHCEILPYFSQLYELTGDEAFFEHAGKLADWIRLGTPITELRPLVLAGLDLVDCDKLTEPERIGYWAICLKFVFGQSRQKRFQKLIDTSPDPFKTATRLIQYTQVTDEALLSLGMWRSWYDLVKERPDKETWIIELCSGEAVRKKLRAILSDEEMSAVLKIVLKNEIEDPSKLTGEMLELYLESTDDDALKDVIEALTYKQRQEVFGSRKIFDTKNSWLIMDTIPTLEPKKCRLLYPFLSRKEFIKVMGRLSLQQVVEHARYATRSQLKALLKLDSVPLSPGLLRWKRLKKEYRDADKDAYNRWVVDRNALKQTLDREATLFKALQTCMHKRLPGKKARELIDLKIGKERIGKVRRALKNLKKVTDRLAPEDKEVEELCPFTQEVPQEPVRDPEGHLFEKESIMQWLASHNTCPVGREPLVYQDLTDESLFEQDREVDAELYESATE